MLLQSGDCWSALSVRATKRCSSSGSELLGCASSNAAAFRRRQFATVQERLADEPMADYVTPVGGGYFFVPRGSRGAADWVGSGLFAA